MKILLDIDDTAMISKDRGKTYSEHPKLKELIHNYSVFLYSGNPSIADYAQRWQTNGYIAKGCDRIPKADVLIDNDADLWKDCVDVTKCYKSIDSFLRAQKRKPK